MLFDNVVMKPGCILEIGKPGSSYAFEIAHKIGLPDDVLNNAKQKIGVQQKKVDLLLVDLEREKKEVFEARRNFQKRESQLAKLVEENESMKTYLEENKKTLLKQAKLEAQEVLRKIGRAHV